ncbi:heterokaryon incompatibility protein-domain-containing protein [Hypoxylon crocopeplum]|nr:heterokaryon incompatibility protein-domain-containing protein [Hypoxylon crocopeplum]
MAWCWGDDFRVEWESELSERMIRRCFEIDNQKYDEHKKITKKNGGPQLCRRCRHIDWAKLAKLKIPYTQGVPIARIKQSRKELQASSCEVCRLGASDALFPASESANRPVGHLIAHSSAFTHFQKMVKWKLKGEDTVSIQLQAGYKGGLRICAGECTESDIGPMPRPDKVDLTKVQSWLDSCRSDHDKICTNVKVLGSRNKPILQELAVIYCRSKTVVLKPMSCLYVALSYVWGKPSDGGADYPQVIEDSITVCLELGYQYLWVDRYCIDQYSATDKHKQIASMDLIYGHADLVIIAAAGEDANYGLPGIGNRTRVPQRFVQIGDVRLIESFDTRKKIRDTTWWTRGWTFQEGLLARRKLIFTEQEVYFQCRSTYSFEAFQFPSEVLLGAKASEYPQNSPIVPLEPLTGFISNRFSLDHLEDQLVQYTGKKLTFESDRLNAFLGILNASRKAHIWGVPFSIAAGESDGKILDVIYLGWRSSGPSQRRQGFPSWSWTGWAGKVKSLGLIAWSYCANDVLSSSEIRYINVAVEVDPGPSCGIGEPAPPRHVPMRRFIKEFSAGIDYTRTSHILEVEAPTIWIRLRHAEIHQKETFFLDEGSWYVDLPISPQESARFQLAKTDEAHEIDRADIYLTVILSATDFDNTLLILVRHSDYYERLGVLELVSYIEHEPRRSKPDARSTRSLCTDASSSSDIQRSNPLWARGVKRRKFRLG